MKKEISKLVYQYFKDRRAAIPDIADRYREKLNAMNVVDVDHILLKLEEEFELESASDVKEKKAQQNMMFGVFIGIVSGVGILLFHMEIKLDENSNFIFYGAIVVGLLGFANAKKKLSKVSEERLQRKTKWEYWGW